MFPMPISETSSNSWNRQGLTDVFIAGAISIYIRSHRNHRNHRKGYCGRKIIIIREIRGIRC